MRWKTFLILCGKYIQDNKYKILSQSTWFCRRCDKNILCVLRFAVPIAVHLQNANAKFHKVLEGSVATLLRWAGKRLSYCVAIHSRQCTPNFIRIDWVLWKIWQKHFGVFFIGSQCSSVFNLHMALNGLSCADVPLRTYIPGTHSLTGGVTVLAWHREEQPVCKGCWSDYL